MMSLSSRPHFSVVKKELNEAANLSLQIKKNIITARHSKLVSIERENQKMLKRLKNVHSNYSAYQWELERRIMEHKMDKHYTAYPHIFKVDDILTKQRIEQEK